MTKTKTSPTPSSTINKETSETIDVFGFSGLSSDFSALKGKDLKAMLGKLQDLQEINQRLDGLVKEIEMLRKQTSLEEKKYNTKKFQYDKNYPALQKAEEEYQAIKTEIDGISEKIEECEEKKKKIKTIKEFKALNKEIDFLSQQNAIKENELLNKSEEMEFKSQKIERISESLQEIKDVFDEKKAELDELAKARKSDIKKQTNEKEKMEKSINPQLVAVFNRIYQNKSGIGIVEIVENICQGCFTRTPRQIEIKLNELKGITYCPFCSRILRLPEEIEEDEL